MSEIIVVRPDDMLAFSYGGGYIDVYHTGESGAVLVGDDGIDGIPFECINVYDEANALARRETPTSFGDYVHMVEDAADEFIRDNTECPECGETPED